MKKCIAGILALAGAVAFASSSIETDVLDAPVWPKVESEVQVLPTKPVEQIAPAVYFKGKVIRAEEDVQPGGTFRGFFLRRDFELRAKPAKAFLQFMADDWARAFVNGRSVTKSEAGDWKNPQAVEVTKELRKGANVLAFRYGNTSYAGGVLGELFVAYADGSSERISTDGSFTALAGDEEEPGWHKSGFDESGRWKRVVTQDAPPAPPWRAVLPYRDYADPKQVAEIEDSLANPKCDVSHVADGFSEPLVSCVTRVAGIPQFAVNGRVFQWNWGGVAYRRRSDGRPVVNPAAQANVVTVHFNYRDVWPKMAKDGTVEFCPFELDRTAKLYAEANPNTYFMWDLSLYPPHGFSDLYPDEMCRNEKGEMNQDGRVNGCFSYSSPHARELLKSMISEAIRYLEASPYANRIVGYRVCGGHTIEWLGWDSVPDKKLMLDFSLAEQRGFETWARPRFSNLTDFAIPTKAEREAVDSKRTILWEPAAHDKVVAYHRYWSENVADFVIDLCRHAKAELANRKLVGTYYGYTMTLPASGYSQMRAHYALKKLLDAKCVDFLMSPQPYRVRNLGDPCGDMKPFATMQAAGVVPVIEDDTRSHLSGKDAGYFQTVTREQSLNVWKRNLATALCRNTPLYFYALQMGNDTDFEGFGPAARLATTAGDWALFQNTVRTAEVALVVSERSVTDEPRFTAWAFAGERQQSYNCDGTVTQKRYGGTLFWNETLEHGYVRWAQAGAPVDYRLAEDLADHPGDYRLYVFLNQFVFDEKLKKAVEKLRERNCTILWMYAPGYTKDGRNSLANMAELTGVEFGKLAEDEVAQVTLKEDGRKMGTPDVKCGPLFYLKDPDEVLGTYAGGEAGVAVKRTGAAQTVFAGAWQMDVPFVRDILRRAGVHVYCESGDPIEANGCFFTLHARYPGVKRIRLPRKTTVLDVYNARIVAEDVDEFVFDAPLHSSWLFYCADDALGWLQPRLKQIKNDAAECGLPVVTRHVPPARFATNCNGRVFVDFGKDAFGWLELVPPPGFTGGVYQVLAGESVAPGDIVDRGVGGSVRAEWDPPKFMPPGLSPFRVPFKADERNTSFAKAVPPIRIPQQYGTVMPFRYAEFYRAPFDVKPENVRQVALNYPIDMEASSFSSSSPELDEVYDLCKYSILATSFAGLYVDGDRERIPYEADAYINQLGHYAVDSDCRLARASHEYLMRHPTWPTEWRQHSVMMAWADWMWSGETVSLKKCYEALKSEKMLSDRVRADGLIGSPADALKGNPDLIDWPPLDRDAFEFRPANAIVNGFRYRNLREMSQMARALGRESDAADFSARATEVRMRYRELFLDRETGLFVDGEGSRHSSLHANVAALAFGLAEGESEMKRISDFILGKGMVCSVYFAQYLLEALFSAGRDREAIELMASRGERCWLNMKKQGATITMEAWDMADKPNLDWNHAWGTPPLNIISRYVLGVMPLEPGFAKISVKPQVGGLKSVKGVVPTAKGPVAVEVKGGHLSVSVPAPAQVVWNGRTHEVPAGMHQFE